MIAPTTLLLKCSAILGMALLFCGCGLKSDTKKVGENADQHAAFIALTGTNAGIEGRLSGCRSGLTYDFATPFPYLSQPLVDGDQDCLLELHALDWNGTRFTLEAPPFLGGEGQSNWFVSSEGLRLEVISRQLLSSPIQAGANAVEFEVKSIGEGAMYEVLAGPACTIELRRLGRINRQNTRFRVRMTDDFLRQSNRLVFYPCGSGNTGNGCSSQQANPGSSRNFNHRYQANGPFDVEVQVVMPWGESLSCILEDVAIPD